LGIPLPSFLQQVAENPPSPLVRLITSVEGEGTPHPSKPSVLPPSPQGEGYAALRFQLSAFNFTLKKNPSVAVGDTSLCTREATHRVICNPSSVIF